MILLGSIAAKNELSDIQLLTVVPGVHDLSDLPERNAWRQYCQKAFRRERRWSSPMINKTWTPISAHDLRNNTKVYRSTTSGFGIEIRSRVYYRHLDMLGPSLTFRENEPSDDIPKEIIAV